MPAPMLATSRVMSGSIPQITQNIGVRETTGESIALATAIEATGLLAFNERELAIEQARSAGLVERVWPLAPGDAIAAGQPLGIWSAMERGAGGIPGLARRDYDALRAGARERMRMLGCQRLIAELEQSGVRGRVSF